MPIVYKITCVLTGQIYFGWTVYSLAQRFSKHCRSRRSYYISRCIQKYGKENFIAEQVFESLSNYDCSSKEKSLIAEYKTNICRFPDGIGMNMTDGGEWGTEGYRHDEETKQKIREISSGRRHSEKTKLLIGRNSKAIIRKPWTEERRRKMSDLFKQKWADGSYKGATGIRLSLETKKKMSLIKKGKKKSEETRKRMSEGRKRYWKQRKSLELLQ